MDGDKHWQADLMGSAQGSPGKRRDDSRMNMDDIDRMRPENLGDLTPRAEVDRQVKWQVSRHPMDRQAVDHVIAGEHPVTAAGRGDDAHVVA